MTNIIKFPTPEVEYELDEDGNVVYEEDELISEEMLVDFLVEHQIETAGDLDDFSQFVHLLMMEPNIPLSVIN
jgi:hypothetical protein